MIWSWLLAAVGVFGLWLAGRQNLWGWAVGLGAQLLWVAYALATVQYGFLASAAAYGWVYGRNFTRWRREQDRKPTPLVDDHGGVCGVDGSPLISAEGTLICLGHGHRRSRIEYRAGPR